VSLEEVGILSRMVTPDLDAAGRSADAKQPAGLAAGAAVACLSVAAGVLLAAAALGRIERVARGELGPVAAWLDGAVGWVGALALGASLGVALATRRGGASEGRAVALLLLCAVAVTGGLGAPAGASTLLAAGVLGVAAGVHVGSLRRLGLFGAVAGSLLAVAAAAGIDVSRLAAPAELHAVGLAAVLFGLLAPATAPAAARWTAGSVCGAAGSLLVFCAGSAAAAVYAAPPPAALAALVVLAGCAAACRRPGLALGAAIGVAVSPALVSGGGFASGGPSSAVGASASDWLLSREGAASVVYVRSNQQMELRVGDQVLAMAGPDRDEEPLLTALAHVFGRRGDVVALLGRGSGRVAPALRAAGRFVVEVLDAWPELASLAPRAAADGPVAAPRSAAGHRDAPNLTPLAARGAASRQLLCVCELPVAATAHRATVSFQRALRRVVGDGVVLQSIALDHVAPARLEQLLASARLAHPWSGLYRVGAAAVLVSSAARPAVDPAALADVDVGWALHRAHLGGAADVNRALVGTLIEREADAGVAAASSVAEVLARSLQRAPAPPSGDGLLRWWSRQQRELTLAREQLRALADDAPGRAAARQLGLRFLARGAPRPWLQAALGLSDEDGVALRDPRRQSRCAHALDPTFFDDLPAVFRTLPTPTVPLGDLEDEHAVTVSERLARRCSGESPLAVALRVRFPSRCARALVEALARASLAPDEALALRELCDPFVVDAIAAALLPVGRWQETLMFWRDDLPLPRGMRAATAALDAAARRQVAVALQSHADASCQPLLADLMLDEDPEVRALVAAALRATLQERVPFDPQWPRSRRLDAASQLLELHNRRP